MDKDTHFPPNSSAIVVNIMKLYDFPCVEIHSTGQL